MIPKGAVGLATDLFPAHRNADWCQIQVRERRARTQWWIRMPFKSPETGRRYPPHPVNSPKRPEWGGRMSIERPRNVHKGLLAAFWQKRWWMGYVAMKQAWKGRLRRFWKGSVLVPRPYGSRFPIRNCFPRKAGIFSWILPAYCRIIFGVTLH